MHNEETNDKAIFGFWVYLMTDLLVFAVLFATFAVLRNSTFGGSSAQELASLPFVLAETLILLTSSFTAGLAILALHNKHKYQVMVWLSLTFLLGLSFLIMEINEFSQLIAERHTPQASASLSSFFTLVGTHGLHIAVGLLWILVALVQLWQKEITPNISSKLIRFSLFWHFLDIVWIFIFTFVYLFGAK